MHKEFLTHLYLQDFSSFSTKPCILITYQNAHSNSKIFSITTRENYFIMVNTIILTISLGNQTSFVGLHLLICSLDPIGDLLISYGFYPFEWINECPYTIDLHGLNFGLYGSKPLIGVEPLYGIHVDDQILVVLIEFSRITSQT